LRALSPWLYSPVTLARDPEPWRIYFELDEKPQRHDGWIRQCEADIAHDASARLGAVEVPALVIVGEDDICTPPRFARELFDLLPRASVVVAREAGHAALYERPDIVASAIEDFLAGV
jgi:pimeloyl-ACP methyl ester carboxylesterase